MPVDPSTIFFLRIIWKEDAASWMMLPSLLFSSVSIHPSSMAGTKLFLLHLLKLLYPCVYYDSGRNWNCPLADDLSAGDSFFFCTTEERKTRRKYDYMSQTHFSRDFTRHSNFYFRPLEILSRPLYSLSSCSSSAGPSSFLTALDLI